MKTKRCVKNNVVVQYHMWLAEQNFWWVAAHSKRSHYKNVTLVCHLRARDAVLAKQKPVENSTIAQSFQKVENK